MAALLNIKVSGKRDRAKERGACYADRERATASGDGNMEGDISAPDCMRYVTDSGLNSSLSLSLSCSSWQGFGSE